AEVAREVALVDRGRLGGHAVVAAEGEELLARAVGTVIGGDVDPTLGVELGEGEAAPTLLDVEVEVLALGGHEGAVAVVEAETGLDRVQRGVSAGGQVVGRGRVPIPEEVNLLSPGGHVG